LTSGELHPRGEHEKALNRCRSFIHALRAEGRIVDLNFLDAWYFVAAPAKHDFTGLDTQLKWQVVRPTGNTTDHRRQNCYQQGDE